MFFRAVLAGCLLIGLGALCAAESSSASYTLERSVLGGAGGSSTSASYSLGATLGQSTPIGESDSTSYDLGAGFWYEKVYLKGDANRDCKVNIIDIILVRNKLNLDASSGDNWRADVNDDGTINIIDIILVRNNLNRRCQ